MSIETILIVILMVTAILGLILGTYVYLKEKTLDDIRGDVYKLFLKAEHLYVDSGLGKQKMKWVIQKARGLLPDWAQLVITDKVLEQVVESWFQLIKDLLDDGKVNKSQEEKYE